MTKVVLAVVDLLSFVAIFSAGRCTRFWWDLFRFVFSSGMTQTPHRFSLEELHSCACRGLSVSARWILYSSSEIQVLGKARGGQV